MLHLLFLLEELSAKEMLKGLLPNLLPADVQIHYVVFEGKQDLEKRLAIKLRAWCTPNTQFIVLRDQDRSDCHSVKKSLKDICQAADKPDTLIRIACRELEAFYLGDLHAVESAIGPKNLSKQQTKSKYRAPDRLQNVKRELIKIAPTYQPVSGSRAIGPLLSTTQNRSTSFRALIQGIQRLVNHTHLNIGDVV